MKAKIITLLLLITFQLQATGCNVLKWVSTSLAYDVNLIAVASCKTAGELQLKVSYAGYRESGSGTELESGKPSGQFEYKEKENDGSWSSNLQAEFSTDNALVVVSWYPNSKLYLDNKTTSGGVRIKFNKITGTSDRVIETPALKFKYQASTHSLETDYTREANEQGLTELTESQDSEGLVFYVWNKLDKSVWTPASYTGKHIWHTDEKLYESLNDGGIWLWIVKENTLPIDTEYSD